MYLQEKNINNECPEEMDDSESCKMTFNLNQSNELFDDEAAAKKHKLINIRRISLPRNGENWEILEDGRKVLILRGVKLTKREKSALRTVEGIKLVIKEYKAGTRSITKIKTVLRNKWKKTL